MSVHHRPLLEDTTVVSEDFRVLQLFIFTCVLSSFPLFCESNPGTLTCCVPMLRKYAAQASLGLLMPVAQRPVVYKYAPPCKTCLDLTVK